MASTPRVILTPTLYSRRMVAETSQARAGWAKPFGSQDTRTSLCCHPWYGTLIGTGPAGQEDMKYIGSNREAVLIISQQQKIQVMWINCPQTRIYIRCAT